MITKNKVFMHYITTKLDKSKKSNSRLFLKTYSFALETKTMKKKMRSTTSQKSRKKSPR